MLSTISAQSSRGIESHDGGPPKKRQRTLSVNPTGGRLSRHRPHSWENIRGRGIPDDIVLEICNHLEPRDLLHFAWTSKHICSLLLHNSSSGVWKSARKNVSYADKYLLKPEGMTEYGYTRLIFDRHCHFCNVSKTRNPLWAWLVRCCRKCSPEYFDECKPKSPDVEFSYYPYEPSTRTEHRIILRSAVIGFQEQLRNTRTQFERETLLRNRSLFVARRNKHAEEERELTRIREQLRGDDLHKMRTEGWRVLRTKMYEAGWKAEYDILQSNRSSTHRPCEPAIPTERSWKRIETETMNSVLDIRAELAERDAIHGMVRIFRSALDSYRRGRGPEELVPEDADIALMEPFTSILRTEEPKAVDYTTFADALSNLPELTSQWRRHVDQRLASMLEDVENPKPNLALATTLFFCPPCGSVVSYPRILSHSCQTQGHTIVREYPETKTRYGISIHTHNAVPSVPLGERTFIWDRWRRSEDGSTIATGILRACGMDPQSTSAKEMDDRNVRLVCRCSHPISSNSRLCMNWRKAIEHLLETSDHETGYWIVLDGDADSSHAEYLEGFRQRELEYVHSKCRSHPDWACKVCIVFRGNYLQVTQHLHREHEMDGDEESQYFRHLDAPPSMRYPFYIGDEMLKSLLSCYDARVFLT